jgi:dUTP pyrophosphatase
MSLNVKPLVPHAIIPCRSTPQSAGFDLFSAESYIVRPGERVVVSTGIQIGLPPGTYGRVAPRSGHAIKNGLGVGAGVVDPDYQGEVKVVLFNHDLKDPFVIKPGYRIAQLILEKYECCADVVVTDFIEYATDVRGDGGFGSTGTC